MKELASQILSSLLVLLALTACGYTGGPSPTPKSLEELKTELGGWTWFAHGGGFELSFVSDGTLRGRIVESYASSASRVVQKCPIPIELLDDPEWTLSNFTCEQANSVSCTLTVLAGAGQPREYHLSWVTNDGPFDHLGVKLDDCAWSLMRHKK